MSKLKEIIKKYRQGLIHFVKFNFVGIFNTGLSLAIYYMLLYFGIDEVLAYPSGYIVGLVNSFIMNKLWTFEKRKSFQLTEAVKFTIVNLIAMGGGQLFIYINKVYIGIAPWLAPLLTLIYTIPVNFIGSKFWAFKDKSD